MSVHSNDIEEAWDLDREGNVLHIRAHKRLTAKQQERSLLELRPYLDDDGVAVIYFHPCGQAHDLVTDALLDGMRCVLPQYGKALVLEAG